MRQQFSPNNLREQRALEIATYAHEGQRRKGSRLPYIVHPIEVAQYLHESGASSNAIIGGLLHDVLEDVSPSRYGEVDMRRDFGDHVTEIVKTVSKPEHSAGDWRYRNDIYLGQIATTQLIEAVEVCVADKLSNINATLFDYRFHGDDLWSRFNAGKADQQWWYQAVYDVCYERIPENPLLQKLGEKVLLLNQL
jgi:(p)ppGpp synthase/HD superfamily hydrolase